MNILNILLLDIPTIDTTNADSFDWLDYGVLGAVVVVLILVVKYYAKRDELRTEAVIAANKDATDKIVANHKCEMERVIADIACLREEYKELQNEKDELYDTFIAYFKENEKVWVNIHSANTEALNNYTRIISDINATIILLVKSIENRDTTTKELNGHIANLMKEVKSKIEKK
jgi:hypothetical protein